MFSAFVVSRSKRKFIKHAGETRTQACGRRGAGDGAVPMYHECGGPEGDIVSTYLYISRRFIFGFLKISRILVPSEGNRVCMITVDTCGV
jgi:hypothetical protein